MLWSIIFPSLWTHSDHSGCRNLDGWIKVWLIIPKGEGKKGFTSAPFAVEFPSSPTFVNSPTFLSWPTFTPTLGLPMTRSLYPLQALPPPHNIPLLSAPNDEQLSPYLLFSFLSPGRQCHEWQVLFFHRLKYRGLKGKGVRR